MKTISKSLKERLINIREKLFSIPNKFGSIVYNKLNDEFGVIVGRIKYKDEERTLIVTIDSESGGSRVRYSHQRNLITVNDPELNNDLGQLELDLKTFCNDQCLFECDKDCVLHKYKKKYEQKDK